MNYDDLPQYYQEMVDNGDLSVDDAISQYQDLHVPSQSPTVSQPVSAPSSNAGVLNSIQRMIDSQRASGMSDSALAALWSGQPLAAQFLNGATADYSALQPYIDASHASQTPVATTATTNPNEPAVSAAPDSGKATAVPASPSWYTNPFEQYQTVQDDGGGYQTTNPLWQQYEDAVAKAKATTTPTGVANSPWSLDASQFHQLVDPKLYGSTATGYGPQEKGWYSPEGQNGSIGLQLAGGKTWTPSGASSGITYHPAGEITYSKDLVSGWGKDAQYANNIASVNPYDYYEISGDMSQILGQPDSNVHANIKYVDNGKGQLVPISEPSTWNYTNNGMFGDLLKSPVASLALAVATGGLSIPEQLAANAALQLAQGKSLEDVAKGAIGSYVASGITGLDAVKDVASSLNAVDPALGQAFNNAVVSGTRAGLTGGNVLDAALSGAATGGINGAIKEALGTQDWYTSLSPDQQKLAANAMTGVLAGKDINQIALDAALSTAKQAVNTPDFGPYSGGGDYSGYTTGSDYNSLGSDAAYGPYAGGGDYSGYTSGSSTNLGATPGNVGGYAPPTLDETTWGPYAGGGDYSGYTTGSDTTGIDALNPDGTYNPAKDSQLANEQIAAEGGNPLEGYQVDNISAAVPYGLPETPVPSGTVTSSPTVSAPKTGITTGTTTGTTGTSTSATSSNNPFQIPWLDTKAQMLTSTGKFTPLKEQELQQIYNQLTPEMQTLLTGGRVSSYSDGSSVQDTFKTISDQISSLTPKFAPVKDVVLTSSGKFNPLSLAALHQIKQSMTGMARGGLPDKYHEAAPAGHNPEFITGLTGYYAHGKGTGQSDDIPAMLHDGDYVMDADTVAAFGDGSSKAGAEALQKFQGGLPHAMSEGGTPVAAKIADGEYVLPASFVTALGGGDNKHGAKLLDEMRKELRAHKRSAPTSKIPPKAKTPLAYLKQAKG